MGQFGRAELGGRLSSRVIVVIGTRPEAIKLAPVAQALSRRQIQQLLVFTGQHPALDPAEYGLGGCPAVSLNCPGRADPHSHVALVTKAMRSVIATFVPDLVLVQGDTSSALGGALAARLDAVPVAHVEAGLRTHDRRRPWPEEEFRLAIDSEAELLFAPTQLSATNLRREQVGGRIHVTGNTAIDAVLAISRRLKPGRVEWDLPRLLVTCHRRENWGSGLNDVAIALRQVASDVLARVDVLLHPNPELARNVRDLLFGRPGISLKHPCSHSETVAAMLCSDLILSDSGGMQEEAAALGLPLLVLRDRTERPEAIACGNVELIGTAPDSIVAAVRRRLAQRSETVASTAFGDGRASERIAAIVEQWLGEKAALSPVSSTWPRQVG